MHTFVRHLTIAMLAVLVAGAALAADWGEYRRADRNLNVRADRSIKAEHRVTLTKGQLVKVDFIEGDWGAIFPPEATVRDEGRALGYANVKYLAPAKAPETKVKAEGKPEAPKAIEPVAAPMSGQGEVAGAAQPKPETGPQPRLAKGLPIQIVSDRMTYNETKKTVSFIGNVKAVHGDLTLWAADLTAYLSASGDEKFQVDGIQRIVASGNVKAKRGTAEGTCEQVTYNVAKQLLTMTGNPVLKDGPNSITGDEIRFYIRENRSEVVGGDGQRVKAVFMSPEGAIQ